LNARVSHQSLSLPKLHPKRYIPTALIGSKQSELISTINECAREGSTPPAIGNAMILQEDGGAIVAHAYAFIAASWIKAVPAFR